MGVGVYGCMPSSGGGEKEMRPHKENDVPGVGAMGCARNISATSWGLMTIPNHQFVDIRRILHIEFTFLILNSGHQGGVVNTLHSLFDRAACVLHHVLDQFAKNVID